MTKTTSYENVKVTINDQNGSFTPGKNIRSCTVCQSLTDNSFVVSTPQPQVKREPTPPLYEKKEYGVTLTKLAKGYKAVWEVNIQQAKTAGKKKVKDALSAAVDAMFQEIEDKNL